MMSQLEQSLQSRNAELEKELEIETALEQIRVRSMAMHQSDLKPFIMENDDC